MIRVKMGDCSLWRVSVFSALAAVFLPATALGETEVSHNVALEDVERDGGSAGGLFEFGFRDEPTDYSQYYNYKAEKPLHNSLEKLSRIDTALAGGSLTTLDDSGIMVDLSEFDKAREFLRDFKLFALPEVAEAIRTHYQQYPEYLWISNGRINKRGIVAMTVLASADEFGLNPLDYEVGLPVQEFVLGNSKFELRRLMEFEMVLSSKVLTYVLDSFRGRIDPNRISRYHDLPRKKIDLANELSNLSNIGDLREYLTSVHPQNRQFQMLVEELGRLRQLHPNREEQKRIVIDDSIWPGDKSEMLPAIVAAIHRISSLELVTKHVNTLRAYEGSTEFTSDLVQLVLDFQIENKLVADGVIGKNTVGALHRSTVSEKFDKVRFAMERLRWLPRNLGHRRVFVNQPSFTAHYWNRGSEVFSMPVVVGKQSSQTSFFYDEIERVVFNPYWSVPAGIVVEEYAHKLIDDPDYFNKRGFQVFSKSGEPLPSSNVNWHQVAQGKTSVRVRQSPGRHNALGELKIMFPNVHAIYMHDTPDKHLFEREIRAFSHGCIRLKYPRRMAAALLGADGEYVSGRIEDKATRSDSVEGRVPVYIAYFTAWPEEDGSVAFFDDLYGRDNYLRAAEVKTSRVRREF